MALRPRPLRPIRVAASGSAGEPRHTRGQQSYRQPRTPCPDSGHGEAAGVPVGVRGAGVQRRRRIVRTPPHLIHSEYADPRREHHNEHGRKGEERIQETRRHRHQQTPRKETDRGIHADRSGARERESRCLCGETGRMYSALISAIPTAAVGSYGRAPMKATGSLLTARPGAPPPSPRPPPAAERRAPHRPPSPRPATSDQRPARRGPRQTAPEVRSGRCPAWRRPRRGRRCGPGRCARRRGRGPGRGSPRARSYLYRQKGHNGLSHPGVVLRGRH